MTGKVIGVFSDHGRLLKIMLPGLIILVLCTYDYRLSHQERILFWEITNHPKNNAGTVVTLSYAKVMERKAGQCLIRDNGSTFLIRPVFDDYRPGVILSGKGRLEPDGSLTLSDMHVHRWHRYKLWISLIPMVVIFFMIYREYSFRWKRILFTRRHGGGTDA